jgi:hypothetical protein
MGLHPALVINTLRNALLYCWYQLDKRLKPACLNVFFYKL